MVNIAQWKVVLIRVLAMVSVKSTRNHFGNVVATMVGMEKTVASYWNRTATTAETMIKVFNWFSYASLHYTATEEFCLIVNLFADGLVDCADPECCSNHNCRSSQLCVSAPNPIDVLLRKQSPAITASFFEKMKFLIDEGSLQNYARQDTFNET